jgi:hypothetical protein
LRNPIWRTGGIGRADRGNLENCVLSEGDPTDHALATIASILDHPESYREPPRPASENGSLNEAKPAPPAEAVLSEDGEGYSKIGPGPIAAIRFKWTARRGSDGEYFVDETIGENSTPIVSGPMSKDAAFRMVDERENDARQRFEQLRYEMTGRTAAANLVPTGES